MEITVEYMEIPQEQIDLYEKSGGGRPCWIKLEGAIHLPTKMSWAGKVALIGDWIKNAKHMAKQAKIPGEEGVDLPDSFGRFIKERCTLDWNRKVRVSDFLTAYVEWSKEHSFSAMSADLVWYYLKSMGIEKKRGSGDYKERIYYVGVILREVGSGTK